MGTSTVKDTSFSLFLVVVLLGLEQVLTHARQTLNSQSPSPFYGRDREGSREAVNANFISNGTSYLKEVLAAVFSKKKFKDGVKS